MGGDTAILTTRRRRLVGVALSVGLVIAVGCTTKSGSTGSPKPTPPTPGQFAPSTFVVSSMSTITLPTYGPTSTRRNTIG